MKTITILLFTTLATLAHAEILHPQQSAKTIQPQLPLIEVLFPMLFMGFLALLIVVIIKYLLEYRLKNKLLERGMAEQLSNYLQENNSVETKSREAMKLAILCLGLGLGLFICYFTGPIDLHSLAIMAMSVGLSYLAFHFYLRK